MTTPVRHVLGLMLVVLFFSPPTLSKAANSAHEFAFTSIEGEPMPLSAFEGKAILIVNTASLCGFTHQYDDLQALWDQYRDRGLVVVGVPSNDFGGQEPGTADEIKEFCKVNFSIDFPLTTKQHVTGPNAHPFYVWTGEQFGDEGKPGWNFHKYLVAPDGSLVTWFSTRTPPTSAQVTEAVERILPGKDG